MFHMLTFYELEMLRQCRPPLNTSIIDNSVNPDFGLLDLQGDLDRHQNVISWSLGHTPALHKISAKSIGNFFDNPVNTDFGLRTPGSGW